MNKDPMETRLREDDMASTSQRLTMWKREIHFIYMYWGMDVNNVNEMRDLYRYWCQKIELRFLLF